MSGLTTRQKVNDNVNRAVHHIEQAMGFLNGAAQIAQGADHGQFHQTTYDLDRAIKRARDAAAEVRP